MHPLNYRVVRGCNPRSDPIKTWNTMPCMRCYLLRRFPWSFPCARCRLSVDLPWSSTLFVPDLMLVSWIQILQASQLPSFITQPFPIVFTTIHHLLLKSRTKSSIMQSSLLQTLILGFITSIAAQNSLSPTTTTPANASAASAAALATLASLAPCAVCPNWSYPKARLLTTSDKAPLHRSRPHSKRLLVTKRHLHLHGCDVQLQSRTVWNRYLYRIGIRE